MLMLLLVLDEDGRHHHRRLLRPGRMDPQWMQTRMRMRMRMLYAGLMEQARPLRMMLRDHVDALHHRRPLRRGP